MDLSSQVCTGHQLPSLTCMPHAVELATWLLPAPLGHLSSAIVALPPSATASVVDKKASCMRCQAKSVQINASYNMQASYGGRATSFDPHDNSRGLPGSCRLLQALHGQHDDGPAALTNNLFTVSQVVQLYGCMHVAGSSRPFQVSSAGPSV